jgi:hypothetical protein
MKGKGIAEHAPPPALSRANRSDLKTQLRFKFVVE